MSVSASWGSTNHLEIASGAGSGVATLDHAWAYISTLTLGTFLTSGNANTTIDNVRWGRIETDGAVRAFVSQAGVSSLSPSTGTCAVDTWNAVAAAYISATHTASYCNGAFQELSGHVSRDPGTINYTRIGASFTGTYSGSGWRYAEVTRWNITGFSAQDRQDLIDTLRTPVSGEIPNPRSVSEQIGQPWTGRLLRYWPLTTNSDLSDEMESGDNFSAVGTVSTDANHPVVAAYAGSVSYYPVVEALYDGAILQANKSGVSYVVRKGTTVESPVVASGTNATINSDGILVLPSPVTDSGDEPLSNNEPVLLSIYWEEGNPAVDRSLIVKTTLVEAP